MYTHAICIWNAIYILHTNIYITHSNTVNHQNMLGVLILYIFLGSALSLYLVGNCCEKRLLLFSWNINLYLILVSAFKAMHYDWIFHCKRSLSIEIHHKCRFFRIMTALTCVLCDARPKNVKMYMVKGKPYLPFKEATLVWNVCL